MAATLPSLAVVLGTYILRQSPDGNPTESIERAAGPSKSDDAPGPFAGAAAAGRQIGAVAWENWLVTLAVMVGLHAVGNALWRRCKRRRRQQGASGFVPVEAARGRGEDLKFGSESLPVRDVGSNAAVRDLADEDMAATEALDRLEAAREQGRQEGLEQGRLEGKETERAKICAERTEVERQMLELRQRLTSVSCERERLANRLARVTRELQRRRALARPHEYSRYKVKSDRLPGSAGNDPEAACSDVAEGALSADDRVGAAESTRESSVEGISMVEGLDTSDALDASAASKARLAPRVGGGVPSISLPTPCCSESGSLSQRNQLGRGDVAAGGWTPRSGKTVLVTPRGRRTPRSAREAPAASHARMHCGGAAPVSTRSYSTIVGSTAPPSPHRRGATSPTPMSTPASSDSGSTPASSQRSSRTGRAVSSMPMKGILRSRDGRPTTRTVSEGSYNGVLSSQRHVSPPHRDGEDAFENSARQRLSMQQFVGLAPSHVLEKDEGIVFNTDVLSTAATTSSFELSDMDGSLKSSEEAGDVAGSPAAKATAVQETRRVDPAAAQAESAPVAVRELATEVRALRPLVPLPRGRQADIWTNPPGDISPLMRFVGNVPYYATPNMREELASRALLEVDEAIQNEELYSESEAARSGSDLDASTGPPVRRCRSWPIDGHAASDTC